MGVHPPEDLRLDAIRTAEIAARPVEAVGVIDAIDVLAAQDTGVAHEPHGAASGERTAAETEEVQLVTGLIVLHEEAVAVAGIARQAHAEGPAANALKGFGADPAVVVDDLGSPVLVLLGDSQRELRNVRR